MAPSQAKGSVLNQEDESIWTEVGRRTKEHGKRVTTGTIIEPLFCSNGFGTLGIGNDPKVPPLGVT